MGKSTMLITGIIAVIVAVAGGGFLLLNNSGGSNDDGGGPGGGPDIEGGDSGGGSESDGGDSGGGIAPGEGDGGTTVGGNDGSDTPGVTMYPIHIDSNTKYTVEGLPQQAAPGERISFTVNNLNPNNSTLDIVVTYGLGYPIAYGNGNSCTFTMPSGDTTVTVNVTEYSVKLSDDYLVVDPNAVTTITRSNGDYSDGSLPLATIWVDITSNQYTNCHSIDIFSLNQSVIPDDAITVDEITDIQGIQYVDGLNIYIDRTLIDAGTALIVLQTEVGSHNYPAEVVIEITVTDPSATASV